MRIAHELYQPLSAIISNANAGMRSIDKGKEDPGTLREILVDVEADGRRAHDIIHNVRNTIKKGDPTRRRINLNELIANVAHVVRPDAVAYFCEVETSLAEDLPLIEVDPIQIQQVLVNLVSNALDAMAQAFARKCTNACSSGSLPPRNRGWEWDWQLCAPSWNLMRVA